MRVAWESAVEELLTRRRPQLIAFTSSLVGRDFAEDVLHDAVVAVCARHRGFTSTAQAESYVRKAIVSRSIDIARAATKRRERERRFVPSPSEADVSERHATSDAVQTALLKLPPRVRACIVLRYLEDLSIRETAEVLGLSEGAVKRYVSDGVATLDRLWGTTTTDHDLAVVDSPRGKGSRA